MHSQLSNSLSEIVGALQQDHATQVWAVHELANIIDRSEGNRAAAVGEAIRDFGAAEPLLDLLDRPDTLQGALRVIGNLASDAVDAQAEETKHLLHELGGFRRVLPCIHVTDDDQTLIYALGAVQNMCTRCEYARHMREQSADTRLLQLTKSSNATVVHFANGCLANMRAVLSPDFVPASPASSQREAADSPTERRARSTALTRHHVAADNSCLFSTIAYLCHPTVLDDGDQQAIAAFELRLACAEYVRRHGEETLALLDFASADAYAEWVTDLTHWGGEPALSMLTLTLHSSLLTPHSSPFTPHSSPLTTSY